MHETLKNVCIFCVFLMSVIFLHHLHPTIERWFSFHHGPLILLLVMAVLYVIVFHALFHYLGKQTYNAVYIVSGTVLAVLIGLVKWHVLSLP